MIFIVLISVVLIFLRMASNKELYDESSRKTYNNIDSREQLMYVEVTKNTFAGYRPELLVCSLSEVEIDFYVCTECKGVMRNACLTGEEQNLVCEVCVKEGVPSQSMVKSRNNILELQAKCPLATRGCSWNGKIAEIEEHLFVCEKVVVKCYNACGVILPVSELDLHLIHSCVKRRVACEYCNEDFIHEKLTNHYLTCLEYQVSCPNNCSVDLKRKLLDSHLELECPNMVVECPYKKYGCGQEVLRRDLEEHKKTNQIQHLESTSIFAIREMEQLKRTNKHLTKTNKQLTERMTSLENEVDMSSYPIILCDEFAIPAGAWNVSSIKEVKWKYLRILVEFKFSGFQEVTSVFVRMENDYTRAPVAKWLFEGRFKLTIIGKKNKSHIYESDFIQLQPRNISKDKGEYPEFLLATFLYKDLPEGGFLKGRKLKFTLQIQEVESE